jgi:hypothetical protein
VEYTFTIVEYFRILPPNFSKGGKDAKQEDANPHTTGSRNVRACREVSRKRAKAKTVLPARIYNLFNISLVAA